MGKFTVRAVLRNDKKNKDGKCPVSICVTVQRKRSYHSTGITIDPLLWDSAKERVKQSTNAASYNVRIGNELARVEKELLAAVESGTLSHGVAKAAARSVVDFYKYAEVIFAHMDGIGQKVTARRYRNDMPSIKAYAGETLNLLDIDKYWLRGFETYCRSEYKISRRKEPEPLAQNSIWQRFKMLRKVLLHAAKAEIIPVCPLGEQRGGYPMPVWEKVPKDYLTMDEVDRLFALLGSTGLTPHEDIVLSFFLIECTAGIRHSDWSRFKIEKLIHSDALKVRTKKTGEPIHVPIVEGTRLARVLNHIRKREYQYSITESAAANRVLKVLAKVAGIEKHITTHTGRHTCCTLLLEKGFSREAVAEVVGVSMKVIDIYAKLTRQKLRNEWDRYGGGL